MGSRSLTADPNLRANRHPRRLADTGGSLRYELNVIAANVADAVAAVGGWMFDRGAAGWDVNVVIHGDHDGQPLRILGVGSLELDPWLSDASHHRHRGAGIAVASDLLGTDDRIEAEVRIALRRGDIEVVQWGAPRPPCRVDSTDYRLSAAARIFKAHALAAACLPDTPVSDSETLWHPRSDELIRV